MKVEIPKPVLVSVADLKSNKLNIKVHPEEQIHDIMELVKMVGFIYPLGIDRKNVIWAGHGRLEVASRLEMLKVPCIYLDQLNEQQKKVFMLMDNKVNESPWLTENLEIIFGEVDSKYFEPFEMKFEESLKDTFTEKEAKTVDGELDTDHKCPKCGYTW